MAAQQKSSGFMNVLFLSRWRRSAVSDNKPPTSSNQDHDEEVQRLRPRNANEEMASSRSFSNTVMVAQKWKAKSRLTTREQMGHSVVELVAIEPAGAQLMPIHELAKQGRVHDVRAILRQTPSAKNQRDSRQATAVHHAASEGYLEVLELLIDYNSDINARDEHAETALHWAVTCEKPEAIDFLLNRGADANVLSSTLETPLHTAIRLQNESTVKTLLKHSEVNVNKAGEHGRKPLHLAATLDSINIIEQLLARGALPCSADANGMRPLQLTARCGGKRHVMEHLLRIAQEVLGYPRELVVNFKDADGMTALHHAVSGGNVEVAKLLLECGCKLLDEESSSESAFHLACSQGSLEMAKVIIENCSLPSHDVLSSQDPSGQTPLHKAAIFNHTEMVKYLIDSGANINAVDKHGRTALLLAAQAGATECVRFLISNGADVQVRDMGLRNVLHVAIQFGHEVAEVVLERVTATRELLDEHDAHGLTPLHYASKRGKLKPVQLMLELGATPNPKNNQHQSPLHFAAKYGRYQTAKRLLQGPSGKQMINEEDRLGDTPLHYASRNGFPRVVELLLGQGALVLKSREGYNPLQSAASGGYCECMDAILASHPYVINWTSNEGDTALHKAAAAGHPQVVEYLLTNGADIVHNRSGESFLDIAITNKNRAVALTALQHDRWMEVMDLVNRQSGYPMLKLIELMPDVAKVVMDRSVTTSTHHVRDKGFWRNFNFKYLLCEKTVDNESGEIQESDKGMEKLELQNPHKPAEDIDDKENETIMLADEQEVVPLAALDQMVKCDRKDLLLHPLCSALLKSRWNSYGSLVFKLNTLLYLIYVIFLTSTVTTMVSQGNPQNMTAGNQTDSSTNKLSPFGYFCQTTVIVLAYLQLFKEIVQMIQLRLHYFTDFTNYMEWTLYVTSILYCVPIGAVSMGSYRVEMGAVAVFLGWINLLLYIQRIDIIGIYVVMFVEVLKTLVVVLSVFFVFIVAFGLAFYALLYPADPYFVYVPRSFLKMVEYMLGEMEFSFFFDLQENKGLNHPIITWIFVVIALIFLPIIFMNLLIGLAVGDIEGVRQNAQLKRLAMQVSLHMEAESKLPNVIKNRVCKQEMKEYPNLICNHWTSWLGEISQVGNLLSPVDGSDTSPETADLKEKLERTETKLKDISGQLEKQHELLRAIMQKMEIKTEAEEQDEGMPIMMPSSLHTSHL
ncbi:transient receptor potential cation channel subfamily A member 1-like [Corticium candelabrum]|uniref:transient receptor potential cation channel subfamily A member 1-like n=1 Tax=Corticium candelabrum TaxID=121492 RepID=UPI002E271D8D|nr:transient receptor potential cation channel subfamily A member 1-like [Corticium candelabrum]